jgi:hypothetical protein
MDKETQIKEIIKEELKLISLLQEILKSNEAAYDVRDSIKHSKDEVKFYLSLLNK